MRATLVVAGALFVLAIAYWLEADTIPRSPLAGQVGADGLPKLLAVTLAVLSVCLALQTWAEMRKQRRSGAAAREAVAGGETGGEAVDWRRHLRALGLIGIGAAYLLLLPILGYAVCAALVLAGVATYTGLRPSFRTVLFGVGGAAVYYVVFVRILGIPLPAGFWPALLG